jgi:N-carbamoylputrescine amidase
MTDAKGDIIENADRESEQILLHSYDLDSIADDRLSWGLFRDRRPEAYSIISSHGEIQ